ncbi:hypothetical protein [Flavobacterium nackdongense]|nr:hypothetical protein [Flavobacterium nackdongense]
MKIINVFIKILLLTTFSLFSQNEVIKGDPGNGFIKDNIFICRSFDWQIKIPNDYKVSDVQDIEQQHSKGIQQAQKSNPNINLNKSRTNLISFEYNNKNTFTSSFTPQQTKNITLNEHRKLFDEVLSKSLKQIKGARFDKKISNIKLGKYNFYRLKIEGYNLNNQLVISQIYYNAIIDKNIFGVLIGYNDLKQGKIMEDNFVNSFK